MDSSENTTIDDYDIEFEPDTEVSKIEPSALQPYQFEPEQSPCNIDEDEVSDEEESYDEENDDATRISDTFWCTCEKCRSMSTYEESLCCREDVPDYMFQVVKCITQHEDFATVCLNNAVLKTTLSMLNNLRGDKLSYNNDSFRYAAYRQFTWWVHNRLGKGVRRVIPSCAIWAIRDLYPDDNDSYIPFREATEEENRLA